MSGQPTGLLPGQSPPLAVVTATNASGIIFIVTAVGLAFALTSLLIRAYVRSQLSSGHFLLDDGAVCLAMVFSTAQAAATFFAASKGWGRVLDEIPQRNMLPIYHANYAAELLYICAIWLSKISTGLLFLRLTPNKRHVRASRAALALTAVTGIVSIIVIAVRCHYSRPWLAQTMTQCSSLLPRWEAVASFDVITELTLVAVSVYLVKGLQMSMTRKLAVIAAFGSRLPIIFLAIYRLHFLHYQFNHGDPSLDAVHAVICTQSEICYAIMAATIPCLRPFVTATATNFGAPAPAPTKTASSTTNSRSREKAFNLSSLTSRTRRPEPDPTDNPMSRPIPNTNESYTLYPNGQYSASAIAQARRSDHSSLNSNDSRQKIMKDVGYTVTYEDTQGVRL